MMKILINSAVIAAGAYGIYRYHPATIADLKRFVTSSSVVSYIGYEETADVILGWTGFRPEVSRQKSLLEPGDIAMVIRLKYRVDPATKGSPVVDQDWEIAYLERLA